MTNATFTIEISLCGGVSTCNADGSELAHQPLTDLLDCTAGGDAGPACRYVLDTYKPEFRIVRRTGDVYENVVATAAEKRAVCEEIYFESDTDFSDEGAAETYLIWSAAAYADETVT